MTSDDRCARCGVQQRAGRPAGLCPGCLLASALDAPAPARIGDYDIIEELGQGGMGVVYRARHRTSGRDEALKVIRAGELATPEERRRFLGEIQAASTLQHPNIVSIYYVGEHAGLPYYTMRLLCAGTLADRMADFRAPAAAARLVATVARAVHHGHQRGVLHRDLKPANILLDEEGQPHVTDLGTAKRIAEPGQREQTLRTEQGVVIGTPMYMAPERVRGGDQGVTTAVDLYSLGVVLYELLTGRLPFEGDPGTVLRAVLEREPIRPRAVAPGVPRDLETICLKCLEKDPSRRYRSAEELADDLDRFLRGEPIAARPASRAGRAWRFARRHPITAAAIVLLAIVAGKAFSVAHAQEQELLRDALQTNAYAARALAGAVAFHLREQLDAVEAAAADPAVARLLHRPDGEVLERHRTGTLFDSISLFDRSGTAVARAPFAPPGYLGSDYSWRDYFAGARRLGERGHRTGYVSRGFSSEADGVYRFAVAAPVHDGDAWGGVLMAAIGTNSALGRMRLDDERDHRRTAVLVAPRDRSRATPDGAGEYVVILHGGLTHGAEVAAASPRLREVAVPRTERNQLRWIDPGPITDDAYRDPVAGFEGRWLAGFAPVGDTGFVVIVQTRHDAAIEPSTWLWRIAKAGLVILASVVLGVAVQGGVRRRRRRRPLRMGSPAAPI